MKKASDTETKDNIRWFVIKKHMIQNTRDRCFDYIRNIYFFCKLSQITRSIEGGGGGWGGGGECRLESINSRGELIFASARLHRYS